MARPGRALRPARGDGSGRGAPAPGGRERAPHGARQGPRQVATSSRSVAERQTDERPPIFFAFVPAASDCNGAARRPRQPAKHGLRAPPALAGTGSALAGARQGPRQAATSSRSAGERQTDGRPPLFTALDPAASDCNGAACRPRQPAKHGLRAPPALAGTGSALAEARQGPRQAATSSRSVGERQTDERHPFFFAFVLVASGLRRAWGPRDPRQAPLAAGSHAIALGCAETTPRGPQPRRRDALPDYDLPRRRRGQRDGEPHVKWPSS